MLWLCLQFPLLPLEVLTRSQPRHATAFLVSEKHQVVCLNRMAARHGISPGMSVSTAQALCEKLILLKRQITHEQRALKHLAAWGYGFTSLLVLQPPDVLLLEVQGSLRLFGGLSRLLRQVETELAERRLTHCAGIAPSPEGARLMARVAPCTHTNLPAWYESAGNATFQALVSSISIGVLDCPEQQQRRLRQMGFETIGDLLVLPRAALAKRFGREFLAYLYQLTGEQPDPRSPYPQLDTFRTEMLFLEPLNDIALLLFPIRQLLRELDQFLDRRQCYCQRLLWHFHDVEQHRHTLSIPCSLQHNSHTSLYELSRLKLESFRFPDAIESLQLSCREFSRVHRHNMDLFQDGSGEGNQQDDDKDRILLDRLAVRLGKTHIEGIGLADTHAPELAWKALPPDSLHNTVSTPPTPMPGTRPFWLLPTPQRLDKRQNTLFWQGRIQLLNGPERIETQWWSSWGGRDYFIARHENGSICWVFREHQSRQWFLHGLFG